MKDQCLEALSKSDVFTVREKSVIGLRFFSQELLAYKEVAIHLKSTEARVIQLLRKSKRKMQKSSCEEILHLFKTYCASLEEGEKKKALSIWLTEKQKEEHGQFSVYLTEETNKKFREHIATNNMPGMSSLLRNGTRSILVLLEHYLSEGRVMTLEKEGEIITTIPLRDFYAESTPEWLLPTGEYKYRVLTFLEVVEKMKQLQNEFHYEHAKQFVQRIVSFYAFLLFSDFDRLAIRDASSQEILIIVPLETLRW